MSLSHNHNHKTKMKRKTSFFLILGGIGIICCSCVLSKIYKYVDYNPDISGSLPDTFRVELPLQMDSSDFFCIRARVNQEYDMDLLIDTGAESLARSEDLKTPKATFWGEFPLPTYNARKEWSRKNLYYYDSFDIGPLSLGKPLFKEITPENDTHIHAILSENGKNVLGRNILNRLNWKFSLDENKMILFSQRDHSLLAKETADGYIKIKDALKYNCKLDFPQAGKSDKFLLDLGFEGELAINKKMFNRLSINIPYREIQGIKGVVYMLEGVDVVWNDIVIKNCQAVYKPGNHSNLIGNGLMRRFNFVLAYTTSSKGSPQRDLYLKPVTNFDKIKAKPIVSDFGFILQKKEDDTYIGVEVNGIADKGGLKTGDRLLNIDKQVFSSANNNKLITYLSDKRNTTIQIARENKILDIYLSLD